MMKISITISIKIVLQTQKLVFEAQQVRISFCKRLRKHTKVILGTQKFMKSCRLRFLTHISYLKMKKKSISKSQGIYLESRLILADMPILA